MQLYSVTELADQLGVTPRALRFYESKGLVTPQRAGRHRVYTHRERGRLALILRGKRLGFTLREIGDWLDLYDSGPAQVAQTEALLARVRARRAALEAQQRDLEATLGELQAIEQEALGYLTTKQAGPAGPDRSAPED